MKFLIFVLMFFVISALVIVSNNNLALDKRENFETFSGLYLEWVDEIYFNSQTITGEAIKLTWLPE